VYPASLIRDPQKSPAVAGLLLYSEEKPYLMVISRTRYSPVIFRMAG
jgi:hypothetical protein